MKPAIKDARIQPIIMCGGSGTRLWPISRKTMPKQFLKLFDGESLFQKAIRLSAQIPDARPPLIVTADSTAHHVRQQLAELDVDPEAIILEPVQRNTAPAIGLAAFYIAQQNRDDVMLAMPADHLTSNRKLFNEAVGVVSSGARAGKVMLMGLTPKSPETGYGYMQIKTAKGRANRQLDILRFVEKPDANQAARFVASGDYLWNCGIFAFTAQTYLQALGRNARGVYSACQQAMSVHRQTGFFIRPDALMFMTSPDISVDYAVMEKVSGIGAVRAEFAWSDVGSWSAMAEICQNEETPQETILEDCHNVYTYGSGRLITGIGLEDLIIVDTEDALLIMPKDRAQDVRSITDDLMASKRREVMEPAVITRPWGTYQSVDSGDYHQVKHITVAPGEVLSLQYHHHRHEHWVIVSGIAEVTVNEDVKTMRENEHVYIPLGAVHRLCNPGPVPLHLVEVQYGSYLGEDDIVRLEDVYERVPSEATAPSVLSNIIASAG